MVGIKLLWTGVTFVMAGKLLPFPLEVVGEVLLIIGVILLWLDK